MMWMIDQNAPSAGKYVTKTGHSWLVAAANHMRRLKPRLPHMTKLERRGKSLPHQQIAFIYCARVME